MSEPRTVSGIQDRTTTAARRAVGRRQITLDRRFAPDARPGPAGAPEPAIRRPRPRPTASEHSRSARTRTGTRQTTSSRSDTGRRGLAGPFGP